MDTKSHYFLLNNIINKNEIKNPFVVIASRLVNAYLKENG
jgi:hypothetical protein